ncbi:hypothetical protein T06_11811 [Trichinella sp. T6]|nr:hypothetical protein T06_11811 [Trichinella sp. T6]
MTDSGSPVRQVSADIKIFWNTILKLPIIDRAHYITALRVYLVDQLSFRLTSTRNYVEILHLLCLTGLLVASLCSGRIFAVVLFKVTLKIV